MKNSKLKDTLLRIAISIAFCFVAVGISVVAQNNNTGPVTVVATILPTRIIVVDENFIIQKIISNTTEDIRPIVVLNSQDGEELPYSDSIRKQYENIKKAISFQRPGIVYEKKQNFVVEFFQNVYNAFRKLIGF